VDNGQAAIDLVANSLKQLKQNSGTPWSYSLILLDYSMPKMDGPTTAMHIC
jgi:CheY-like chemotaxis protein